MAKKTELELEREELEKYKRAGLEAYACDKCHTVHISHDSGAPAPWRCPPDALKAAEDSRAAVAAEAKPYQLDR